MVTFDVLIMVEDQLWQPESVARDIEHIICGAERLRPHTCMRASSSLVMATSRPSKEQWRFDYREEIVQASSCDRHLQKKSATLVVAKQAAPPGTEPVTGPTMSS